MYEDGLIPVTMHIHIVNNKIKTLGSIILDSVTDPHPSIKLFKNPEACAALAKTSENFPTMSKALQVSTAM